MSATVEVRFKGIRKDYYRWAEDREPLHLRDAVIVEAERGLDFGRVSAVGDTAAKKCGGCSTCGPTDGTEAAPQAPVSAPPIRPVVRLATQDEIRMANDRRRSEEEIRLAIAERARSGNLPMRISDVEWQWDRKKLTIYFTAETRVDFRSLVRELAAQHHTRIDLRQIGVRDEAARLGGVGRCGREYCCSTWLKDLNPVSLGLAKDQHLSLNPAQISGGCGRLLCCLRYEHEFYVAARKRFPKEGKTLRTARGAEKVVAVDIFRERVFLRNDVLGPRTVLLADLKAELEGQPEAAPPVAAAPAAKEAPTVKTAPAARTAAARRAPAARASGARAPGPAPAAAPPAEPAQPTTEPARKRRRRRRGRRGGSTGPAGPEQGPEQ